MKIQSMQQKSLHLKRCKGVVKKAQENPNDIWSVLDLKDHHKAKVALVTDTTNFPSQK